jgi:hypothetical protein
MVFAVVAGVVMVAGIGAEIGPGALVEGRSGVTWLTWTAVGFGVALVGGTSAFGRRGGVFGTILAVLALVLFHRYQATQGWEIALLATAGVAVAAGLVATRLVETFGGSRLDDAELGDAQAGSAQWETTPPASTRVAEPGAGRHTEPAAGATGAEGWPASSADSWSSALPARPAPGTTDPWDDDRWSRR